MKRIIGNAVAILTVLLFGVMAVEAGSPGATFLKVGVGGRALAMGKLMLR